MRKLIIILMTAVSLNVSAQNDSLTKGKDYLSLEIDPTPFIFGGYSFSIKYSPAKYGHLAFMTSVYSSDLPDNLLSETNYGRGFRDVKLNASCAFFVDYFLKSNRKGFYFGPSVFCYSKTIGIDESTSKLNFKSIYPNIRLGYVFHPFCKSGFYINPWVNFGKEYIVSGASSVNGIEYSTKGMNYIVAIHLGYRIEF